MSQVSIAAPRFDRFARGWKWIAMRPLWVLVIVECLSLLIYTFSFARPLYLLANFQRARLDTRYLYWWHPHAQIRLLLSFLALGLLYAWGWWAARRLQGRRAWMLVLGGGMIAAFILLWMMPIDAADIYDNIVHGRILAVYGRNPFVAVGRDFSEDPFYGYMAWKRSPSAYGPLWELIAGGAARLAGDDIPANILLFKLLPGFFWLGSMALTAAFLRKFAPQYALANTFLLVLNPMVLYATWGNGHNDITIVFSVLLAAWALAEQRYTLSILALLAGALFKYIPLLLLPAALVTIWVQIPDRRARLRFMALTVFAGLALLLLAYAPFWTGPGILTIKRRTGLFSSSLPAIIYHLLWPQLGKLAAGNWISGVATLITGIVAIRFAGSLRWKPGWQGFVDASFDTLAFYMLLTCLWFQQWYTVWLVGLAALLPWGFRQRFAVFFSLAVLLKQLWIGPQLLWPRPVYTQPELEVRFTLGVLGLPWLYALAGLKGYGWASKFKKRNAPMTGKGLPGPALRV